MSAGVVEVLGDFKKNDFVDVLDESKSLLARGLSSCDSVDVKALKSKIIVHRDNLSLL